MRVRNVPVTGAAVRCTMCGDKKGMTSRVVQVDGVPAPNEQEQTTLFFCCPCGRRIGLAAVRS
jgi:hypothetical protein